LSIALDPFDVTHSGASVWQQESVPYVRT